MITFNDRAASRDGAERSAVVSPVRLVLVSLFAALAACGGSSDGSVGVGSGQAPDPVVLDFPIAYTRGPLADEELMLEASTDIRELNRFNVGTDLYVRDRASPSSEDRNVTLDVTEGLGDVQGLEISADGSKVLFSMRGPFDPNLDDDEQPTWNVWEYDVAEETLTRLIASDITAEAGHDLFPHYLPDGRIIFSSTRQRQAKAMLLDEGKPQFDALDENRDEPAFVLHVMDADGENLKQVSFNQSHDLEPTVLDDGRILFSRWDGAGNADGIHFYTMNPDGTDLELLYGAESHATGTDGGEVHFVGAREMPDGRVMAIARPFEHEELGGDVVVIDVPNFVENDQPIAANAGLAGPAQAPATSNVVRTDELPSPGGRFSSAFPLWDGTGRVLVTWTMCRLADAEGAILPCTDDLLEDPAAEPAPPLYGVWIYDPRDETQRPVVVGEEGIQIAEVVAAQPRAAPQFIPDEVGDADLAEQNAGVLNIRSVYDVDGVDTANPDIASLADPAVTAADERPARFLRVVKAVSIPDDDVVDLDNTAFGPNNQQGMREIVAYAPIEPDGSVRIKVPAQAALAVEIVDRNGRRISPRHQNWLQVMPGQEVGCNGCHDPGSGLSHGRAVAFEPVHEGAPSTGVPFTNAVMSIIPDFGETMAEARTRVSCQTDCAALTPSVDLLYTDVWTDPNVRAPDADLELSYGDLTTAVPTSPACQSTWDSGCRIVIHYEEHIHPIWSVSRQTLDEDEVTVLEDNTCTRAGCHVPLDDQNMTAVPAAQLDLSDGQSPDVAEHFNAYRELLFRDNEQELVNGALQDVVIEVGVDDEGNPILQNVPVQASMSAAGANASGRFFSRFDAGGTHAGYLSPAELRLISEWLDIGAQYYNDPFAVPQD